MTKFEVICSVCMATVEPIDKYGLEICPVCGLDVETGMGVEE